MEHTYNLSTQRLRQEDHCKFQASLDYVARSCLKKPLAWIFSKLFLKSSDFDVLVVFLVLKLHSQI